MKGPHLKWQREDNYIAVKDLLFIILGLPWWLSGKESACNAGDQVLSLGWEDSLEKGMATHSSILAWRIPWTEKPSGL